ncbi:hypothetical protein [Lysobacter capsici]|uniref:hypothetical protein n=1 Tax=Lysobacter capsici TaxID=435897 RepID=UPI00287B97EB|nr:hypothetical protein [Lysobacter capsici]WND80032.1 hypothetical protein RJ610_22565 [Lysobacter capsici]WND85228.1 hypothetical protein RJ609_22580 [Lysobacter capsici]
MLNLSATVAYLHADGRYDDNGRRDQSGLIPGDGTRMLRIGIARGIRRCDGVQFDRGAARVKKFNGRPSRV